MTNAARIRSRVAPLVVALLGLAASAAGCDCGTRAGLKKAGPAIQVKPASLKLEGTPGRVTEAVLKVTNAGTAALTLAPEPKFVEKDGDGVDEFGIGSLLDVDCTGAARHATPKNELAPGECGELVVRYLPNADGKDPADLHLYSNDSDVPDLDVPIDAAALTPQLQVCAYDGQTKIDCATPGSPYEVDFGLAEPGTNVVRTIRLTSTGSTAVQVNNLALGGDADFALAPSTLDATLSSGQSTDLTATFDALAGGGREADVTFKTDDPKQGTVTVRLVATGDASRLCLCVGSATERCNPLPIADFGQIPVNGQGHKYLRLASCGTKPLTLKVAQLTDGAPEFSAQAPNLGGGLVLQPGQQLNPDIPLTFAPTAAASYTGKFTLQTDSEHGYVSLAGEGVPSGCDLESPSNTIDFGQVGIGATSRKDYTVANRGTKDCLIPAAPQITSGADARFALAGTPPPGTVVPPGQTARFTVSYAPQDMTPDSGTLAIGYGDAEGGAATSTLQVQLKGTPTAAPVCVLTVNPRASSAFGATLNFGQVRVNAEKDLPVVFQNTGSAPCALSNWRVSGFGGLPGMPNDAPYFKIKTPPTGTLQPGDSTTLEVSFIPDSDRSYGSPLPGFPGGGTFGVNLFVNTSDAQTFNGQACAGFGGSGTPGCAAWALTGQGVKSDLHVLPGDLDFGEVTLGCNSEQQKVTLYNVGQATLTIQSIKVDPAPPPEIFHIVAPATPFTLPGGGQVSVTVRYRPPDASIHTGTLYIQSDATNVSGANPYTTVGLKGEGTTSSHQTDTFTQDAQAKTDVLFMIDNSGSTEAEHGYIAQNAQQFLNVADQMHTNYQVAVITTDMDDPHQSGKFQGTPKIITPGASAASQFSTTVRNLGSNGSGTEKGLAATYAALTDPLINDPNTNKGFLRPDAKLAVIEVSDEDDQSDGTVDFYSDFLKTLKGPHNESLVSMSAIVGDSSTSGNHNSSGDPGCTSSYGDAVSGDRYIAVQQATGGKFRSICSADWGQIATDLGLDAFAARAGFALSRLADPATIHVKVNGQSSPSSAWSYDANSNSVVFNLNDVPEPGATIVVDYDTLCL